MKLLEGKKISDKILDKLRREIRNRNLHLGLAVILIGENQASQLYVNLKEKAAEKIGIKFSKFIFSQKVSEKEILDKIVKINLDKKIHGIVVQLPLPKKFHTQKIINAIDPKKDVDGFHPENIKCFSPRENCLWPVFPKALLKTLEFSGKQLENRKAVILAKSKKFGETMKLALEKDKIKGEYLVLKKASDIKKYSDLIKNSDIIISACGFPQMIKGEMIEEKAIIIDGGITKRGKKVLGDADFDSVKDIAGYISPVPGGVGPVTIACLLENVFLAGISQIRS